MSLLTWVAALAAAAALRRVCPACHHRQTVPHEKLKETVPCARCGAPVPAGPPARRPTTTARR